MIKTMAITETGLKTMAITETGLKIIHCGKAFTTTFLRNIKISYFSPRHRIFLDKIV
jgi:hypothetical protein